MTESNLIPKEDVNAIMNLDRTIRTGQSEIKEAEENPMLKGMLVARLHQRIRELLTPEMMNDIRALMNTPLGFRTDRDSARTTKPIQPYDDDTLRDVVIVALLDGARIVGNEFNVIAGNYYRTVEQLKRKIAEFPGLSKFRFDLGVPEGHKGGALVPCRASWEIDGRRDSLECVKTDSVDLRIPVRVNEGMGADAILGKARRKLFYRVLERLTGNTLFDEEVEERAEQNGVINGEIVESAPEPEHETESEPQPQSELDEKDPLDGVAEMFEMCKSIRQADSIRKTAIERGLNDAQQLMVDTWHLEACDRIRGSRGERSNKAAAHGPATTV